ncbi:hypothetical protein E2C01_074383 [Portunus trituberculatus]|uniref:Uncharacterized protein n=1 Tax=Portunus trituberculatus TaxID=210409 RepID=A0A5B7IC96_PORTR|nr:hypothetical protein [Portunus trituberculatus]
MGRAQGCRFPPRRQFKHTSAPHTVSVPPLAPEVSVHDHRHHRRGDIERAPRPPMGPPPHPRVLPLGGVQAAAGRDVTWRQALRRNRLRHCLAGQG